MKMNVRNKRGWWIVGIMIVALLVSGCQGATQVNTQVAASEALTASGTIRATEVRVASELGGRILEVAAKEGQEVQTGDVLVLLDATPLLLQLSQAEAAVVTAQADLAVVQAGPSDAEVAAVKAALDAAIAERDGKLAAWENAQGVVESPQDLDAQIVEARTQVDLAAQAVELAEAQLAREQLLSEQKSDQGDERRVADLQVRAAVEALAAAQADEKAAQTLLNQLLSIRRDPLGFAAQANAAQGYYLVAEEGVAVAQARLDDLLDGPMPEEVAVAEASVRLAEAQANVLQDQVDKSRLRSPITGVVLEQSLRAGELVAPAATILTLADLGEVTLDVYVPENRVGEVQLGQAVQVTVDSFPGRAFDGRVARIGDEPEFTPRNVATAEERLSTFYAVEIQLPNPAGLLKPGMPADATF